MTIDMPAEAGRSNPLLSKSDAPYGAIPFDKIQLSDYEEAVLKGIELQNKEIEKICSNPETPTFENTIVALDRSGKDLNRAILTLSNLEGALGQKELMEIMAKITPDLSAHQSNIILNEELWKRIKTVYDNRDNLTNLNPEQQRLLNETYLSFYLEGADLQGKDREKYRKLNAELSDLTVKFSQNVTNDMANPDRTMWLTADQLSGLPESIKNAARESAKESLAAQGKEDDGSLYLFTVFMPSYSPFMKYADNRDLRKQMYMLYNSRNNGGKYSNIDILKDIANVRLEIAQLMGKKNYAEYRLQHNMANTPEKVMNFLDNLRDNYMGPMRVELDEIQEFARTSEGEDFVLESWDYSYWADKLKNKKYAFNDEDMKPYFEINNTINGVFGLATKLYGFKFKENKNIPVYHPDVKAYEVYRKDGSLLGVLYADFYYRPGKAPGAWMTEFRSESKDDNGNRELPLISIVCNFSKPVGNDPVLLTPSEVNTFLHEFGHALHGLSAEAQYQSLSGTNVYHDFVELFSQFNENYLTEKEFVDGFARHYKTGKKMPKELLEKFIKSSQYGAAYACIRQLGFGYLDMAYYTIEEPLRASADIPAFEKKAQDGVRSFDVVEGCVLSPAFGHVFSGGYSAGYYGYKWSEVLDADAFSAFKETGNIFDKKTAAKYYKMMSTGGASDPMELYIEFRGHEPSVDALMKRDGIIK